MLQSVLFLNYENCSNYSIFSADLSFKGTSNSAKTSLTEMKWGLLNTTVTNKVYNKEEPTTI